MFIICNPQTGKVEHEIHDHTLVTPELESRGMYIDSLPTFPQQAGKSQDLYYDSVKKTFSVVYVPIPLTPEQRIEELEQNLGNVLLESAADKAKIAEMETSQGDLLMEIATLKMGGSL